MTDRAYPAAKPAPSSLNPNTSNPPSFPPAKPNVYRPPVYRPTPQKRRRRGNRCCLCCIWFSIFLLSLILLAAIAASILYVLYRPHQPSFSISSLRFSSFNLTSTNLNSHLNLSISARNTNKNLVFFYDPISVSVLSTGVDVGDGSFPGFVHGTKNTTLLRTSLSTNGARDLDLDSISSLSSAIKKKSGLPLIVRIETKVRVKVGGLKTKKVGIRVLCDGINAPLPKGKSRAAATASDDAKCKVKLRFKIWKWEV